MTEKKKSGLALILLLIVGAGAFGFGINWGLPSKNADKYFFSGFATASSDSKNSYERSGAGIAHLAGDWEDDANRGSDVATHPVLDRSKPVTLIENINAFTKEQILQQQDVELAHLVALQNKANNEFKALSKDPNATSDGVNTKQKAYFDATSDVGQYVLEYNVKYIPGYTKIIQDDSVNRARIVRRYRLYSDQPDEMITLRALGRMHPSKFDLDPKLYQYGGLWIYPIGVIAKVAGATNLLTVVPDVGGYVDQPGLFAPFYILMRVYSSLWGLVAVIAVFFLIRRFTGGWILPVVGGLCFIFMPVVLNMAHEGKPHLAGVALVLLSVLAASKYVETGKTRWAIYTGLACGAAAAMVLSGLCALVLIPLMVAFRKEKPARFIGIFALGIALAAVVYFATNPYVAIHLLHAGQPNPLTSNMENSKAMYQRGPIGESIINAICLLAAGASVVVLLAGVAGKVVLLITARRQKLRENQPACARETGWLLAAVSLVVLIEFILYAAAKPPEYARFGALVDVAFMIAAVMAIGRLKQNGARVAVGAILVLVTVIFGLPYLLAFEKDAGPDSSRIVAANKLNDLLKSYNPGTHPVLGIYADPAPFNLPPVDLYGWNIVLLPPNNDQFNHEANVIVKPVNHLNLFDPAQTPISWANTEFEIINVK